MNKLCLNLVKQSLQSNVFRSNQMGLMSRVSFCSSTENKQVPLSKNPKHKTSPQVTLITGDKLEVVTLDQAKKIAERRQLKLVSVVDFDTKSRRAVYKLMTGSEYLSEDLKNREQKKQARQEAHIKGEKLLSISTKIAQHDLEAKLSKCVKWIEKLHEIRVVITGDPNDSKKNDEIFKTIEEKMQTCEGRVLQKRTKEGTTRFSILPTIKKEKPKVAAESPKEKSLLEPDKSPVAQQIKSLHTNSF